MKRTILLLLTIVAGCTTLAAQNTERATRRERMREEQWQAFEYNRRNEAEKSVTALEKITQKGKLAFSYTLPFINSMNCYVDNIGYRENVMRFLGIGFTARHNPKDRRYIEADWQFLLGSHTPLPVMDPAPCPDTRLFQQSIALSYGYYVGRFSLGWGVNMTQNIWKYYTNINPDSGINPEYNYFLGTEDLKSKRWNAGIKLNAIYFLSPYFSVGMDYRPTFYQFGAAKPWRYQHSLSLVLSLFGDFK